MEHVKTLWNMGEAALLSLENLDAIEKIELPDDCTIYTCENESPFANMVRKRHPGLVIYTQGFPNTAVCRLYRVLAIQHPDNKRLHWGDTDLAGLQIASILHVIASLQLWRFALGDVAQRRESLIPLDEQTNMRINQVLASAKEFPFRENLQFTSLHGWLEQERFEP
jgi:hypothetical protein